MAAWAGTAAPATQEKQAAAGRLENAYAAWDDTITVIDEARKKQMAAPGLAEPAKKALATPGPRMGRPDRAPGLPDGVAGQ